MYGNFKFELNDRVSFTDGGGEKCQGRIIERAERFNDIDAPPEEKKIIHNYFIQWWKPRDDETGETESFVIWRKAEELVEIEMSDFEKCKNLLDKMQKIKQSNAALDDAFDELQEIYDYYVKNPIPIDERKVESGPKIVGRFKNTLALNPMPQDIRNGTQEGIDKINRRERINEILVQSCNFFIGGLTMFLLMGTVFGLMTLLNNWFGWL